MRRNLPFLILMLVAGRAFAAPEIAFEREIEISAREKITWADLATVSGGTSALLSELASVVYSGGGAKEIRSVLRERKSLSEAYRDAKISIPQEINLKTIAGYSRVEFRRKLLNKLGVLCSDCRFEIRSVRDENVRLAGDWSLDDAALKIAGSLLVPVMATTTVWIPVQMRVLRPALVLRKSVILGQRITSEDVETREVDIASLRDTVATLKDLDDTLALRTLRAGQPLTLGDLRREDAVRRGLPVKLSAGNEDFEITVTAIAEDNGRTGDLIKVKNVESGRVLMAVVTGRGEARLQ